MTDTKPSSIASLSSFDATTTGHTAQSGPNMTTLPTEIETTDESASQSNANTKFPNPSSSSSPDDGEYKWIVNLKAYEYEAIEVSMKIKYFKSIYVKIIK